VTSADTLVVSLTLDDKLEVDQEEVVQRQPTEDILKDAVDEPIIAET